MAAAAAESRPEVGSSRSNTRGCLTSAMLNERRRRWPPESPWKKRPPALVCCADVMPVAESRSSIAASRAPAESAGW
eukprot:scaffold20700_cov71-Phaeocystis_antarctica.AAC.4